MNNLDLTTMTPAQQKRFNELFMRDLKRTLDSPVQLSRPMTSILSPLTREPRSVDDFLNRIENTQRKRAEIAEQMQHDRINQALTREELFRFAYVPFVIAELVWDYADTVLDLSHRNPKVKKLSRAIKNARRDYDSLRRQYIDENNRKREIENMYVFEDGVKRITSQMLTNIDIDIKSEYPDLMPEYRDLLIAVYQCHVLSRALVKYTNRESVELQKKLNQPVGNVLPPSYFIMDKLIPEFVGDKPASPNLRTLFEQYINSLSVQIGLIDLNDETEEANQTNFYFSKS